MAELIWLLGLLTELEVKITFPVDIFSDSKSALQMAANPVFHERTKHIEIDCHFIGKKSNKARSKLQYIPIKEQPADLLTKGSTKTQHQYLSSKLGVLNIYRVPNWREC